MNHGFFCTELEKYDTVNIRSQFLNLKVYLLSDTDKELKASLGKAVPANLCRPP